MQSTEQCHQPFIFLLFPQVTFQKRAQTPVLWTYLQYTDTFCVTVIVDVVVFRQPPCIPRGKLDCASSPRVKGRGPRTPPEPLGGWEPRKGLAAPQPTLLSAPPGLLRHTRSTGPRALLLCVSCSLTILFTPCHWKCIFILLSIPCHPQLSGLKMVYQNNTSQMKNREKLNAFLI